MGSRLSLSAHRFLREQRREGGVRRLGARLEARVGASGDRGRRGRLRGRRRPRGGRAELSDTSWIILKVGTDVR